MASVEAGQLEVVGRGRPHFQVTGGPTPSTLTVVVCAFFFCFGGKLFVDEPYDADLVSAASNVEN
jgi:hypothetical protein